MLYGLFGLYGLEKVGLGLLSTDWWVGEGRRVGVGWSVYGIGIFNI